MMRLLVIDDDGIDALGHIAVTPLLAIRRDPDGDVDGAMAAIEAAGVSAVRP